MWKSVWVAFVSLQSMAACGYIGSSHNGYGNGLLYRGIGRALGYGGQSSTGGLANRYTGSAPGYGAGSGLANIYDAAHGGHSNGGFNIGNGYLGYSNYHRAPPVKLFDVNPWKPLTKSFGHNKEESTHFSMTPSISYGYSYKLVPTHAYGPAAPTHGRGGGPYGLLGAYGR